MFDLFHVGHANVLRQARALLGSAGCPVRLIAGVHSDATTARFKGPTVIAEADRYALVRHCRYVDEVVLDAPWATDEDFVRRNKIDFVAHDDVSFFPFPILTST